MPYRLIGPGERLDFTLDWADFLDEGGSPGDTISSSAWSIAPLGDGSPTAPVVEGGSYTPDTATIFVRDCVAGRVYELTNRVTTAMGRTAERSITLRSEPQ